MTERNPAPVRSHIVMLRVTPDERAALEAAAARKGLPMSTYTRTVALKDAARVAKVAA